MSTNYRFFDPSTATDLAKFQGTFAGIQAGNASVTGVASAPTSIYNQAGWYAMEDTNTGLVTLQKLSNDSLYTKQWYDQTSGTIFDFTDNGKGIVSTRTNEDVNTKNSNSFLEDYVYGNGYIVNNNTNTNNTTESTEITGGTNTTETQGTENTENTENTTNSDVQNTDSTQNTETELNGDKTKTLTAADLLEMVEAGVYKDAAEALYVTLYNGYEISDEEQAKLGIYEPEDEKKISLMTEKYGISRNEAASTLGLTLEGASQYKELEEMYASVQDEQGFIGKAWNGFKNFFDTGVSSDDVEYAIEKFKNGEISYTETKDIIEEYQTKQHKASKNVGTAAATIIGTITAPFGPIGSFIAGAVTKAGIGIADRSQNNIEGDELIAKEVMSDAASGGFAGGFGKIIKKGVGFLAKIFK